MLRDDRPGRVPETRRRTGFIRNPLPIRRQRSLLSVNPAPGTDDQLAVLKSIYASPTLGSIAAYDDPNARGLTESKEADRDYSAKIEALIGKLKAQQKSENSAQGDITQTGIVNSLDEAIRLAKLNRFETFLGEDWSAEHLRSDDFWTGSTRRLGAIDGTNRGAVSMNELDSMIKKAARDVHAHLFETSEMLAANHSATLFIERLYETHGNLIDDNVREDMEPLLARAADKDVAKINDRLRSDADSFALRYRERRIIFDCLSENLLTITASDSSGVPSHDEIEVADA